MVMFMLFEENEFFNSLFFLWMDSYVIMWNINIVFIIDKRI